MPLSLATLLLQFSAAHLAVGALLLPWLVRRWWPRAAPGAHGATWGFIALALPGTLLLWPVLLWRAGHPASPSGEDPRGLRRSQSALLLVAVAVVMLAVAFSMATRPSRATMDQLPAALGATR